MAARGSGEADDDDEGDDNHDNGAGVAEVSGTHQVLAFNDLGMHCADLDYSTFVILPPFNVIHSQVIERGNPPRLLDDGDVQLSYLATADPSGSITTTSQNLGGSQLGKPTMSEVMHRHHGALIDESIGEAVFPSNGTLEQTSLKMARRLLMSEPLTLSLDLSSMQALSAYTQPVF